MSHTIEIKAKSNGGFLKKLTRMKNNLADMDKAVYNVTEKLNETIKSNTPVDTGLLRDSFHTQYTNSDGVFIGTIVNDQEYLKFILYGTGIYHPNGRQGGWVYQDRNGDYHFTYGIRPNDFIKTSLYDVRESLRQEIRKQLFK